MAAATMAEAIESDREVIRDALAARLRVLGDQLRRAVSHGCRPTIEAFTARHQLLEQVLERFDAGAFQEQGQ